MKQTTFASAAWANKGKVTRRERFLAEMNAVIPWKKLIRRIRPHYMKLHVGTDPKGTVHSVTATHAGAADIKQLPELLHGEEKVLFGDQAYWSEFHRDCAKEAGVRYRVTAAPSRGRS